MKLQTKILLPTLLLIMLLMTVSGVLSYTTARDSLTSSLIDNFEGEANSVKRSLVGLVNNSARDTGRMAVNTEVVRFFNGDINDRERQLAVSRELDAVTKSYPDFDRMTIYDLEGNTIGCSDTAVLGQNFADRDYFKQVRTTSRPTVPSLFGAG